MRAVSAAYLRAQAGSGNTIVRVRPCNPTVRDASGYIAASSGVGALPVIGGELVLDGTADLRMRTEGLTLAPYWPDTGQDGRNSSGLYSTFGPGVSPASTVRPGQPVWPLDAKAPFTPYGKLLLIEFGTELGGGNVEYARAGYVRVDSIDQQDEPDGPITVETSDLSAFLQDSGMVVEITYPASTTMQAIFEGLVISTGGWRGMPDGFITSDIDLDPTFAASTLGAKRTTEGDRLGFLAALVADRGYAMWWDGRGKLVVRPPSDPNAPVLDIGGPNDLATPLTQSGRSITREGVANVVIADQSGITGTPGVRSIRYWNPGGNNSAMDVFPFGFVTANWSSPLIVDQTSADAAAATRLSNLVSLPDQRRARHVVNGSIEPGDWCRVWPRGSDDLAGWTVRQVLSTRLPLVPGNDQVTDFRDLRVSA